MAQTDFASLYEEVFPFWEEISDTDKSYICQNSYTITYPMGKNVHDGGECSGVILVRSGSLRVYMMSENGKDITLYRLHKGDMCMLSASCVLEAITFDVFIDADEDSECCVIGGLCCRFPTQSMHQNIRIRNSREPFFRCDVGNAANPFYEYG